MQYTLKLPQEQQALQLYFNDKVYNPAFSTRDTVLLALMLAKPGIAILDVACGCGVNGLTLKLLNPSFRVVCSDISREAVRLTKLNAKRNGLEVSVLECDLVPETGEWHLIVANLPTFSDEDLEVHELHGPKLAYRGGDEPLDLYKRLFAASKGRCAVLIAECQEKYQESFKALVVASGWDILVFHGNAFALIESE